MRTTTRTRQELIAVAAVVASLTTAGFASYLLLVGPSPRGRQVIAAVVPHVGGLDAVAVAALVPTTVVATGVLGVVCLEAARQFVVARGRRRELEAYATGDRK